MWLKDISSSQLKKPIEIITVTIGKDEDGLPIEMEQVLASKKAKVSVPSLRKQEVYKNDGISVTKTLEFIFRFEDIDESAYIRYRGDKYNIRGIENVEEKDKFLCVMGERTT